jgi:tetratricopeptide (TPR) repeat protein
MILMHTNPTRHLWIVGASRAARQLAVRATSPDFLVSCHRQLRGPHTGVGAILNAVVPEAFLKWPQLVETHRVELLYIVPELAQHIGQGPRMLVESTPHEERTRYFGQPFLRAMNQGIITFLIGHARNAVAAHPDHQPLVMSFDDVHAADPVEQEFLAILMRRADPSYLRVVACAGVGPLPQELEKALGDHAELRLTAVPRSDPTAQLRDEERLVRAFVLSDGASEDPAEIAAYAMADPVLRARLHDARADELEPGSDRGLQLGAIPYHRERGSDPDGARRAVRRALEHCVAVGYSETTIDFGMRGRALCDPVADQEDYCHFSAKMATAFIPLGKLAECAAVYSELRRRYAVPRVQMTCCYAQAMLHTRFYRPPDHEAALELVNTARALASLEPDPLYALYFQVYEDNGIALVEMHRGNLGRALELINAGMDRLDREMPPDRYVVHRSQLLHNRARLLVSLGRLDEAYDDFTRLIEWDECHAEYHTDRGNLSRRRGDLKAALADYDRALEVSAPFVEILYNRVEILLEQGQSDSALAGLGDLLEMEPDFLEARVSRASLRLDADDLADAMDDVMAGLTVAPTEPRLLCLLGLIEQAQGEPIRSRTAFDAALAADPAYGPALANRAVLAYEQGDPDGAITDLDAAAELMGPDPSVLLNRGIAYLSTGRPAQALRDFDAALRLAGADLAELQRQRERCLDALAPIHQGNRSINAPDADRDPV